MMASNYGPLGVIRNPLLEAQGSLFHPQLYQQALPNAQQYDAPVHPPPLERTSNDEMPDVDSDDEEERPKKIILRGRVMDIKPGIRVGKGEVVQVDSETPPTASQDSDSEDDSPPEPEKKAPPPPQPSWDGTVPTSTSDPAFKQLEANMAALNAKHPPYKGTFAKAMLVILPDGSITYSSSQNRLRQVVGFTAGQVKTLSNKIRKPFEEHTFEVMKPDGVEIIRVISLPRGVKLR